MNNNDKFTQKWAIASFFSDLPIGLEFPMEETPLHATLAGVFSIEMDGDAIADLLRQPMKRFAAFTIKGESIEKWGGNIDVTLIKPSDEFDDLYRTVQNVLQENGAVYNQPQYTGDGFRPHVTTQKSEKLEPGSVKTIQSVSLVDMFPGGDGLRRRIHATLNLSAL